jgi:hypothetical protein
VIRATLTRQDSGDQGTFGRIVVPGLALYTGELPSRDNHSDVSCILVGVYNVIWTYSDHFKREMYLLLGTEPRAGIRAHSANLMGDETLGYRKQLNGCIALGEKLGWIDKQKALLLSSPAVRRFETHLARQPFTLEIVNG